MSSLSSLGLAFYVVVLIGAFAVRSAAGFGAVLIAVPMLAFVLPVPTAVSVASALTIVTSTQQVSRGWSQIAWAQFFIVSFYTMIGIGLGFYFISMLNETAAARFGWIFDPLLHLRLMDARRIAGVADQVAWRFGRGRRNYRRLFRRAVRRRGRTDLCHLFQCCADE
jgi:uncharacterized membrane protein YfcA